LERVFCIVDDWFTTTGDDMLRLHYTARENKRVVHERVSATFINMFTEQNPFHPPTNQYRQQLMLDAMFRRIDLRISSVVLEVDSAHAECMATALLEDEVKQPSPKKVSRKSRRRERVRRQREEDHGSNPVVDREEDSGSNPVVDREEDSGSNPVVDRDASPQDTVERITTSLAVTKMSDDGQEDIDDSLCVICIANDRTHVVVPCGHMCLCGDCASLVGDCPMCRAHAQCIVRVFK